MNTGCKNHPYHIVNPSPWPICTAFATLLVFLGILFCLQKSPYSTALLGIAITILLVCLGLWWRDVIYEGQIEQMHTTPVKDSLRIGMILFIISEVMFFFGFFISIFKNKLMPSKGLNGVWAEKTVNWAPESFQEFDPWNIPFMNTIILLLSSQTLAWAQYALHFETKDKKQTNVLKGLQYTILLGISFTILQIFEYAHAPFRMQDGIVTSNFYIATGFHGLHVIIGTIFLIVCYARATLGHFQDSSDKNNILCFNFAVWYWHFVDAIWILLFIFLYLWT